jgi:transcriptional regulator with XRE-family HTH domain
MGVSQPIFAKLLNVSLSTVKAWENEYREPDGATKRLLEVAEKHSEILLASLVGHQADPPYHIPDLENSGPHAESAELAENFSADSADSA